MWHYKLITLYSYITYKIESSSERQKILSYWRREKNEIKTPIEETKRNKEEQTFKKTQIAA